MGPWLVDFRGSGCLSGEGSKVSGELLEGGRGVLREEDEVGFLVGGLGEEGGGGGRGKGVVWDEVEEGGTGGVDFEDGAGGAEAEVIWGGEGDVDGGEVFLGEEGGEVDGGENFLSPAVEERGADGLVFDEGRVSNELGDADEGGGDGGRNGKGVEGGEGVEWDIEAGEDGGLEVEGEGLGLAGELAGETEDDFWKLVDFVLKGGE